MHQSRARELEFASGNEMRLEDDLACESQSISSLLSPPSYERDDRLSALLAASKRSLPTLPTHLIEHIREECST